MIWNPRDVETDIRRWLDKHSGISKDSDLLVPVEKDFDYIIHSNVVVNILLDGKAQIQWPSTTPN